MRIIVDQEGANAIQMLINLSLKQAGVDVLNLINAVRSSMKPINVPTVSNEINEARGPELTPRVEVSKSIKEEVQEEK